MLARLQYGLANLKMESIRHHNRDDVQPADLSNDGDLIAEQMGRLGGTTLYFDMLPLLQAMLR